MILQLSHSSHSISQESWEKVIKTFKNQIGSNEFQRWFTDIHVDFINGTCFMLVPDDMSIAWIEANYLEELKAILPLVGDQHSDVNIVFKIQDYQNKAADINTQTTSTLVKNTVKKNISANDIAGQAELLAKKKTTKIKL